MHAAVRPSVRMVSCHATASAQARSNCLGVSMRWTTADEGKTVSGVPHREGVPVVLMEALASRRPVVASAVAGVGELVETGVSGLTVPPGDVPALTEAIATLLDDPALRARMGEAGRARVAADYDSAREAAWLKALMQGGAAGALPEGLRPSAD